MTTRHDHRQHGLTWMDGTRCVATARPVRSGGWMASFKDRQPYDRSTSVITTPGPTHCRHFAKKREAVESIENILD